MTHSIKLAIAVVTAGAFALGPRAQAQQNPASGGGFQFDPLPASAQCALEAEGDTPLLLPQGYSQQIIAREGDGGSTDVWDMNTLNETGPQAGRYLYRTHETAENGQVTRTDLTTGETVVVAERHDWNRLDGIVWTPWGTLLIGEEMRPERLPSTPDPDVPQAQAGLVYEIDPTTGSITPRPAAGAAAHEGLRFDPQGNLYGISETGPTTVINGVPRPGGYIFKFVPDRRGDLSSGVLYTLQIVAPTGDRIGEAIWIPLDRESVQVDADAAATAAGATGYARPEDVETATSTGNEAGGGHVLFVSVTGEARVLRIDLRGGGDTAFVSEYVRAGVNAPSDFANVDNLALDKAGNLFIVEDNPGATPGRVNPGNDVWMAVRGSDPLHAATTVRFASVADCTAEPSGIYFDTNGKTLFMNLLARDGVDPRDVTLAIREEQ